MELKDVEQAITQRSGAGATIPQLKGMLNLTDGQDDDRRRWRLVAFIAQLVAENRVNGMLVGGVYRYYAGRWKTHFPMRSA